MEIIDNIVRGHLARKIIEDPKGTGEYLDSVVEVAKDRGSYPALVDEVKKSICDWYCASAGGNRYCQKVGAGMTSIDAARKTLIEVAAEKFDSSNFKGTMEHMAVLRAEVNLPTINIIDGRKPNSKMWVRKIRVDAGAWKGNQYGSASINLPARIHKKIDTLQPLLGFNTKGGLMAYLIDIGIKHCEAEGVI